MCSLYINNVLAATLTHLALSAGDAYTYTTEEHQRGVFCKLQRSLTTVKSSFEPWNINLNEEETQAIYFSRRLIVPHYVLQVDVRCIPSVNNVTYLGVTIGSRVNRGTVSKRTVTMAFRMYIRTYFLFKSGCLSTNINLKPYKALIGLVINYAFPTGEYAADGDLLNCSACRTEYGVLRATGNLDRCTPVRRETWLLKFLRCTTI
jgi:hypothetical protein